MEQKIRGGEGQHQFAEGDKEIMREKEKVVWVTAQKLPGLSIKKIHRIFHHYSDGTWSKHGMLQLTLSNDAVFLFKGSSDGDTLSIEQAGWQDPFHGELDTETLQWIASYGKPELVNVTEAPEYKHLLGQTIRIVWPIFHELGSFNGIQIQTDNGSLNFIFALECDVISDEELNQLQVNVGYIIGNSNY